MRNWRKMMAGLLGGILMVSQGMAVFASEEAEGASGGDTIVKEDAMPQMGAGIGMTVLPGGIPSEDTDTNILEDLSLSFQVQGAYMLMNAEDEHFYYIYTWGEQGIPDIIVGAFDWSTTDGFFEKYGEYMTEKRPDLRVAEAPCVVTIGDKSVEKIVYSYSIQGYAVRDTRYIWLGPNSRLYMFAKREIPDISYTLGSTLEDIIASAAVTGEGMVPQAETTVPQPETSAPDPGTAQTPAPSGQAGLYTQNADSSWSVTTQYYTMTIPPAWTGHFDASVLTLYDSGYNLQVVNKESADAGFGGHLFTIMLVPQNEDYTLFPSYDYLGTMDTPEGTFHVVVRYPTDVQTGDVWSEFYKILYGDKNSALTTMRPVQGVVWTLPDGQTVS